VIINLHDWTVVLFVFNVLFINVLSLLDACLLISDPIQKANKKQNKTKQKTHKTLDANVYHVVISLTYYMLSWPMCPDLFSFLCLKLFLN
jgi:uncharacterized membrane protein